MTGDSLPAPKPRNAHYLHPMSKRLLSVGLLVVTLAIGFGLGRALGADDSPTTSTTSTTIPESAPPTTQPRVEPSDPPDEESTAAPVLGDLVPELSHPLLLETTNPTRLLRWNLSDAEPGPVNGLPPGSDLTLDRDARFVLVTASTGTNDVLVGGLLNTPLSVMAERVAGTPTWADFSDHFWFIQGNLLVRMDTRGTGTFFEIPTFFDLPSDRRTRIAVADDGGAVVELLAVEERSSVVVRRVLVQSTGMVELPTEDGGTVVGIDEEVVLVRGPGGSLTPVDRSTGLVLEDRYTACGVSYTEQVEATVCAGPQVLFLEDSYEWNAWTSSRWSGSGRWFMAVGGDSTGRVLLLDTVTREATVLEISLPDGSALVDIWSGA